MLALPLLLLLGCPQNPPEARPSPEGAPPPNGGPPPSQATFQVQDGQGVEVTGKLVYRGQKTGQLRVDFLRMDPQGRPELAHTMSVEQSGAFQLTAPAGAGELHVVGLLDVKGDGPSADDPAAATTITVGDDPISGLVLTLSDEPDLGPLTPGAPPPGSDGGPGEGPRPRGGPPPGAKAPGPAPAPGE